MAHSIIVYADYKYYLLDYDVSDKSHTEFDFVELCNKTEKLNDVLPKHIYSYSEEGNLILDINNNIHCVTITRNFTRKLTHTKFDYNIIKAAPHMSTIVGYNAMNIDGYTCHDILLGNINSAIDHQYEYFRLEFMDDMPIIMEHHMLQESQVTYNLASISVKTNKGNRYFVKRDIHDPNKNLTPRGCSKELNGCMLLNINNDIKRRVLNPTQKSELANYKYLFNVNSNGLSKYTVTVDNDNNCYVNDVNFYKLSNSDTMVVNCINNCVMMVNENQIVGTSFNARIVKFTLPVKHICQIGNTKVNNIVWSEDTHSKLPKDYQTCIKTVILCNKLMKYLKIPRGVLSMIFNLFIN